MRSAKFKTKAGNILVLPPMKTMIFINKEEVEVSLAESSASYTSVDMTAEEAQEELDRAFVEDYISHATE